MRILQLQISTTGDLADLLGSAKLMDFVMPDDVMQAQQPVADQQQERGAEGARGSRLGASRTVSTGRGGMKLGASKVTKSEEAFEF